MNYDEADPISRNQIEEIAAALRSKLGLARTPLFPVARVLEHALPILFGDEYSLRVASVAEMGNRHAYAQPDLKEIVLREDIYDGIIANRGRDRMTGVHELGHLILHGGRRLHRQMSTAPPVAYRDPEWQAKCFAGAIMMPANLMTPSMTVSTIMKSFGVSPDAARYRYRQLFGRSPQY